jgi:dTMP kinase
MRSARRGYWISIDGTNGTGKTTLAGGLVRKLRDRGYDATGINGFSDTPFGDALRQVMRNGPPFKSASPLGRSLFFLADFVELYHSRIAAALEGGTVVVTDRGWANKYAYQLAVLTREIGRGEADTLLRHILGLVDPPHLALLLRAPGNVIARRLVERDGWCNEERSNLIEDVATAVHTFAASFPGIRLEVLDTDKPVEEVLREATDRILAALEGSQLTPVG